MQNVKMYVQRTCIGAMNLLFEVLCIVVYLFICLFILPYIFVFTLIMCNVSLNNDYTLTQSQLCVTFVAMTHNTFATLLSKNVKFITYLISLQDNIHYYYFYLCLSFRFVLFCFSHIFFPIKVISGESLLIDIKISLYIFILFFF